MLIVYPRTTFFKFYFLINMLTFCIALRTCSIYYSWNLAGVSYLFLRDTDFLILWPCSCAVFWKKKKTIRSYLVLVFTLSSVNLRACWNRTQFNFQHCDVKFVCAKVRTLSLVFNIAMSNSSVRNVRTHVFSFQFNACASAKSNSDLCHCGL